MPKVMGSGDMVPVKTYYLLDCIRFYVWYFGGGGWEFWGAPCIPLVLYYIVCTTIMKWACHDEHVLWHCHTVYTRFQPLSLSIIYEPMNKVHLFTPESLESSAGSISKSG